MKYMLIMSAPQAMWQDYYSGPIEDLKAQVAFMRRFNDELKTSGELVATHGLNGPASAPERDYLTAQAARLDAEPAAG